MTEEIMNAISSEVYGVWFLIGAALVFWMQAGFAMVEAGFTRAKNTGNIIMKNLMDFCIGTVVNVCLRVNRKRNCVPGIVVKAKKEAKKEEKRKREEEERRRREQSSYPTVYIPQ